MNINKDLAKIICSYRDGSLLEKISWAIHNLLTSTELDGYNDLTYMHEQGLFEAPVFSCSCQYSFIGAFLMVNSLHVPPHVGYRSCVQLGYWIDSSVAPCKIPDSVNELPMYEKCNLLAHKLLEEVSQCEFFYPLQHKIKFKSQLKEFDLDFHLAVDAVLGATSNMKEEEAKMTLTSLVRRSTSALLAKTEVMHNEISTLKKKYSHDIREEYKKNTSLVQELIRIGGKIPRQCYPLPCKDCRPQRRSSYI